MLLPSTDIAGILYTVYTILYTLPPKGMVL